jgi:CRISPR/Cas system CSM-associated protein Csm3 (group 7 of RAMP superfamily)
LQQHAEDEFTGGVFPGAKFDRVAVMSGRFETRLVIEARSMEELLSLCQTLAPGLSLASAGFVPLGGGKWRGLGWLDWKWSRLQVIQAGREAAVDISVEDVELDLVGHIERMLEETA